jgi:hypothetical protein
MILWLVALPGFQTISSVSRIVNIVSLVVPGTACLHILGYLGAITKLIGLHEVQIAKCEITVPICIIEGTDNRAAGFRGYIPQLLNFQYFWCISSILKELYFISDAPLNVLKFKF